ncbi:MAG: alpha-galactosidase [Anaerolineaceae bacterium]|jgi:alpha-galactosidase
MAVLQNKNYTVEFEKDGSFSVNTAIHSKRIVEGGIASFFYTMNRKYYLGSGKNAECRVALPSMQETAAQGKFQQIEATYPPDENEVSLRLTYALLEEAPLFMWKMTVENGGDNPIDIDRLVLLAASKLDLGFNLAFYANGWQSWDYTATYGADEPMRQSRLAFFQGPQWINPGTPTPRKAGEYASDFFGVIGDRTERRGVLLGFLSQKQHFGTLKAVLKGNPAAYLWANGDNARLKPGKSIETDWAVLDAINIDDPDPLGVFVEAVARENAVHLPEKKPSGWCSWYEFYTHISEEKINANLKTVVDARDHLPLDVVQIDDGFESQIGDWLTFKREFPHGVAPLAKVISENGYVPGLWLAPFIVHPNSKLIKDHPDWMLRGYHQRFANTGFNWNKFTTVLDLTVPAALDYACQVVKTAAEEWGFPYLKLDFLYAAAVAGKYHDPTRTRAQVLRQGMEAIRKAVGEKTFLLGCGAPLGSMVGLVDAMRIGEDVSGEWLPAFGGLRQIFKDEPNMPAAKNAIQNTLTRTALHRRWWLNDPDCLLVRSKMALTLPEVYSLASAIAMSGGMVLLSDNLPALEPDRLRIAETLLPPLDQRPQVMDWFDRQTPALLRQDLTGATGSWQLIALFNWDEQDADLAFSAKRFNLPEEDYWLRSFWDGKVYFAAQGQETIFQDVPPHGVVLLSLRTAKTGEVLYLGSDLHFTQGTEVTRWQITPKQLNLRLELPRVCQGMVELLLPAEPRRAHLDDKEITWKAIGKGRYLFPVSVDRQAELKIEFR